MVIPTRAIASKYSLNHRQVGSGQRLFDCSMGGRISNILQRLQHQATMILAIWSTVLSVHAEATMQLSRRGFLWGSSAIVSMPHWPCGDLLAGSAAPLGKLAPPRFSILSEALTLWPRWAAEMPRSQGYFNPRFQLDAHLNPVFMSLPPQKRFERMQKHLLSQIEGYEQQLEKMPEKIAANLGWDLDSVRNLTQLFLDDQLTNISADYLWMKYYRDFFIQALTELEQIDRNLAVRYRLMIQRYPHPLDESSQTIAKFGNLLARGENEYLRIVSHLMKQSADWNTVLKVANAIHSHWWPHLFPGYNRDPKLSDLNKSPLATEALSRFLLLELPKIDLQKLMANGHMVTSTSGSPLAWDQMPLPTNFPVQRLIETIVKERLLSANKDQGLLPQIVPSGSQVREHGENTLVPCNLCPTEASEVARGR